MSKLSFKVKMAIKSRFAKSRVFNAAYNHYASILNRGKRNAINDHGAQTAKRVVDAVQGEFKIFLMFGTLLGSIRENDFIAHDEDLDFGVLIESGFSWERLEKLLTQIGCKLKREYSFRGQVTEQTYDGDGFSFDVFGLSISDDGMTMRSFYYPRRDYVEYDSYDQRSVEYIDMPLPSGVSYQFLGNVELPVPANAEEVLATVYGPSWREPDPNWPKGEGFTRVDGEFALRIEH